MTTPSERSSIQSAGLTLVAEIEVVNISNILIDNHRFYRIEFEARDKNKQINWTVLARYSQLREFCVKLKIHANKTAKQDNRATIKNDDLPEFPEKKMWE